MSEVEIAIRTMNVMENLNAEMTTVTGIVNGKRMPIAVPVYNIFKAFL